MPKARVPTKDDDEARTLTPSVRMSATDLQRIKAAAAYTDHSAYTEFMYRAVMNTVEAVEAQMKQTPKPTTTKTRKKRR